MILGGIEIYYDPIPLWSSPNYTIKVKVNYVYGQSSAANPPTSGDIIIDIGKRIWRVVSATYVSGSDFMVVVTCISETPANSIIPNTTTAFGLISTPTSSGAIMVPFDQSRTEHSIARVAANYNMEHIQSGSSSITNGNDIIGLTITGTAGQVLGVTSTGIIGLIPGGGISDSGDLIGLPAPSGATDGQVLGVSGGQLQFINPGGIPAPTGGTTGQVLSISSTGTLTYVDPIPVGLPVTGGTQGQVLGIDNTGELAFVNPLPIDNASDLVGLPATGASIGQVLGINSSGQVAYITPTSGGASTFTGLSDVPDSYSGMGGKLVAVKSDGTGIEFIDAGGIAYVEYPINVTYNTGGTIEPHGIFNASEGSNITFTITPDAGYEVQGFTVNGVQQTIVGNSFTVSNIGQTTYVVATFGETGEVTINPGTFPPFNFATVDTTKSLFAIGTHSIAMIGSDGNIYNRGINTNYHLGDGTTTNRYNWGRITTNGGYNYIKTGYNIYDDYIISSNINTKIWGTFYRSTGTVPLVIDTPYSIPFEDIIESMLIMYLDTPLTYDFFTPVMIKNVDASNFVIKYLSVDLNIWYTVLTQSGNVLDTTRFNLAYSGSNKLSIIDNTNKVYDVQISTTSSLATYTQVSELNSINTIKLVGSQKDIYTYVPEYNYCSIIALTDTNDLYFWGYDGGKRLYWDEFNASQTIATPTLMSHGKFKDVGISINLVIAIENTTSYVHTWGTNARTNTIEYREYPELGTCKAVYGGYDTVMAITNDNKVYIWGNLSMLDPNLTTWIDVPFRLNQ